MSSFSRVMVVAWFFFAGCTPELKTTVAVTAIGDPSGAAVTTTVGAAGGTVRSGDGQLEFIVPAGALAADTALSVTPISVTAPGGVKAFRLGPEGTTFSRPASVKLNFTEEDLGGSTPQAMRIAFQDSKRRWQAIKASTVDSTSITVTTTHLSDWSLLVGWQLRPPAPKMTAGARLTLDVRFCNTVKSDEGTQNELVSLVAECQVIDGLSPMLANWAVNGINGGNSSVGTVRGAAKAATYTAPTAAPSPNTVAVSVEFSPPAVDTNVGKGLLVSNVTIQGSLPNSYQGTAALRSKVGGPFTSLLAHDERITAVLKYNLASGTTYDLAAGTAMLVSAEREEGGPDCRCTASNVTGVVKADPEALVLTRDGKIGVLRFQTSFSVPWTCTSASDPNCRGSVRAFTTYWSVTSGEGQNPACTNTKMLDFSDPSRIDGFWTTNCPANPVQRGEIEEVSWSLVGNQ